MSDWKNRIIGHGDEPLDEILFNPANWRIHPKAQQEALEGVLSQVGYVQDVIINKQTGHLVDGHLRCQVAARNGEKTIPAVYVDLTPDEESLILATIDPLSAMAATDKQKLDDLMNVLEGENNNVKKLLESIAEKEHLDNYTEKHIDPLAENDDDLVLRVPDAVWGSDNEYGIPMLDINMQATALETPFAGWGTMPRKSKMTGTWHFYVDDYRFENVWKNPIDVANTSCYALVEPNFSVYDDMPKAVALWQVYRKRWLARWLQSVGIMIFVDLNISHKHDSLRFMGVPAGWKAYATRAYSDRLDETVTEYQQAISHANGETILFVCYGGGKEAEKLAQQYGWIWYQDQQTKDAGGKNG